MNKVWFGVYTRKVSFSIINRVWWFGVYTRKVGFSIIDRVWFGVYIEKEGGF